MDSFVESLEKIGLSFLAKLCRGLSPESAPIPSLIEVDPEHLNPVLPALLSRPTTTSAQNTTTMALPSCIKNLVDDLATIDVVTCTGQITLEYDNTELKAANNALLLAEKALRDNTTTTGTTVADLEKAVADASKKHNALRAATWNSLVRGAAAKMQLGDTTRINVAAYSHISIDQDSFNFVSNVVSTPELIKAHNDAVAAAKKARNDLAALLVTSAKSIFN